MKTTHNLGFARLAAASGLTGALAAALLPAALAVVATIAATPARAGVVGVTLRASALEQAGRKSDGRLFLAFSRRGDEEPRRRMDWPVAPATATRVFAMDVSDWDGGPLQLQATASYPIDGLGELAPGQWYAQALLDRNTVLPDLNAPGNLYSPVQPLFLGPTSELSLVLDLAHAEPAEMLPQDTDYIRYVKIRSELLSRFYGRDIHLRAAVLLPQRHVDPGHGEGVAAGAEGEGAGTAAERYPVLYHIGGLNARFTRVQRLWEDEAFRTYWTGADAAPVVMVFLDGMSPWGDSYQVNSAVSGPYADANFAELFPYLGAKFPIRDENHARFLSGCSTGGWVAMALQVFYPDYFAGSWPFSPDSPTFSAFQLVDLYEDDNAFVNEHGMRRPSMRSSDGEPMFGVGDEIAQERVLGAGDNWLYSGQQWAVWNAIYGQLDAAGEPIPVWDESGNIDPAVVASWAPWDIERFLIENWARIGPSITGKLHFTMGDMDNFYLNVGLRRLQASMAELSDPPAQARFDWVPEQGHCGFGVRRSYIDVLEAIRNR